MADVLRIGNAQGFWGDSVDAPARLVAEQPDLDYLTLDYLAEVSLSILAIQRDRDPSAGFARDFLRVVERLVPAWKGGAKVRIVTNAGGLHPRACARACAEILRKNGLPGRKVGLVGGDDCLDLLRASTDPSTYRNLDTQEPLASVRDRLVTANAYLGAAPVAEALRLGADIVVTGRVADPSLAVAPCIVEFGWRRDDWDRIAAATVAGHLIECGAQVTGGISTDWLEVPHPATIGFPVVEISPDGGIVVTKPEGTGGRVDERTVKEQLLYEMGDPDAYVSPDAVVSLMGLSVERLGKDRVGVRGAKGRPATDSFKVSATFREGYKAHGLLTIFGRDAVRKARRSAQVIFDRLAAAGYEYEETLVECLGTGAVVAGVLPAAIEKDLLETVLRVSVRDPRKDAIERFALEIAPLVTSGAQGTTGYAAGRPAVQPVFGYWPCLIEKSLVQPTVDVLES